MIGCKTFRGNIIDFIHGEIKGELRSEMEKHIEECSECSQLYDEELRTHRAMKEFTSEGRSSFVSSRAEIMKRIDKNRYEASPLKRALYALRRSGLRYAINALIIIVLTIGGMAYVNYRGIEGRPAGKVEVGAEVKIDNDMDVFLSNFLVEYGKSGGTKADQWFESHYIYGYEEKDNLIYIYLHAMTVGYSFEGESFKESTGSVLPMLVVIEPREGGGYGLKKSQEPVSGEGYSDSIRRMFPGKIADKVVDGKGMALHLSGKINKKVIDWLQGQNKENYTIVYNYYFFEMPNQIVIYNKNEKEVIKKGDPRFNEILYLTFGRFQYEKLNGEYEKVKQEAIANIIGNEVSVEFMYSESKSTSYDLKGADNTRTYQRILIPLTGDKNYLAIFGDSVQYQGRPLGDLLNSSELLKLASKVDYPDTQVKISTSPYLGDMYAHLFHTLALPGWYPNGNYIALDLNSAEDITSLEKKSILDSFKDYKTEVMWASEKDLNSKGLYNKDGKLEGVLLSVISIEKKSDSEYMVEARKSSGRKSGITIRFRMVFKDGRWLDEDAQISGKS